MKRRQFLQALALAASGVSVVSFAAPAPSRRLLILVELKGGNDGLNTVVPYADARYRELRPRLAIERDAVIKLSDSEGLHPALAKLEPLWSNEELAIVRGVGYPQPNLSHFRSIEIWDTASRSDEYLASGWLSRAFAASPSPASFAAEGVVVGATDMGPFAGARRAVAISTPEQFVRSARLAREGGEGRNAALAHLLRVEHEVVASAAKIELGHELKTEFPAGAFGAALRTATRLAANPAGVAAIRVSLNGFDTHANQPNVHAGLLRQLGDGMAALREGLREIGAWDSTVVATYSEFGRRPKQNESNGTDHGTVAPHFVMGGKVRGGLYGAAPDLGALEGGNLVHAVDFRDYYATILARWWGMDATAAVGEREPLGFIAA